MNQIKCLIMIMILCLAITGTAFADDANGLAGWGTKCVSSDPPGTADFIDQGNSNGAVDVGSMECWINKTGHLECKISNGYPGYQAAVYTEIINTSRQPVSISEVEVIDKPDCILVGLTDMNGNSLINQVIDKNSSLAVKVVNRISENVAQTEEYKFETEIVVNQGDTPSPSSSSPYNSENPSINLGKNFTSLGEVIINTISGKTYPGPIAIAEEGKGYVSEKNRHMENNSSAEVYLSELSIQPINGVLVTHETEQKEILDELASMDGRLILFMGFSLSLGRIGLILRRRK